WEGRGGGGAVKVAGSPRPSSGVLNVAEDTSCWTASSCLTVTVAPGATVSGAPYPKSLMVITGPEPVGVGPLPPPFPELEPQAATAAAARASAAARRSHLLSMFTDGSAGWFTRQVGFTLNPGRPASVYPAGGEVTV